MNEPGHSKIVEETTKTTFISSTSIVNEELHIVESSSKSAAIENGTKVNKTVVEVKGLETKSKKKKKEKKAHSRSSSSSSSSSEDESSEKQVNNESEKEIKIVSVTNSNKEPETVSSSSSSDEENEKDNEETNVCTETDTPETDVVKEELEIHADNSVDIKEQAIEKIGELEKENDTEEEVEAKRKASLIQAEVKVVPDPVDLKDDKVDSSSSSSSSSDNEEDDESTNKDTETTDKTVEPHAIVEDSHADNISIKDEEEPPAAIAENDKTDTGNMV